jgi:hypothetical protein
MRVEIDLTEDDTALSPGDGLLPEPTLISDDGDILLRLADTSIRMTHSQFERILGGMNAWWDAIPSEPSATL